MKIKVIIFDVDGLMADTEYYQCKSIAELMSSYGVKLNHSYHAKLIGVSTKDNFLELKKRYNITENINTLLAAREKLYLKTIKASGIRAYPGLKEILEYAKKKGIKIAIGSSSVKTQINVVVPILIKSIGIRTPFRRYFDAIVTGSDVKKTKPAPDIYNLVSRKLGIAPHECLVLEDSVSGVKAAKAAKMFCIAVKNRYSKNHDLNLADCIVKGLKEALKEIKKIGEI
ncbi:MAG: HAD family phosphatase [Candidatus Firestonebacteria bacterium]